MSEKIEPVFSARVWSSVLESIAAKRKAKMLPSVDRMLGDIATLNASLPDSDPRKITRDWIAAIRSSARRMMSESSYIYAASGLSPEDESESKAESSELATALLAIADNLESYLPPIVPK